MGRALPRQSVRPQLLFRRSVLPLQVLPHNTGRTSDEFDAGALFVIFGRPFRRHGFLLAAGEPQQFAADDRTVLGAEPLGELLYERVSRGFGLPDGRIGVKLHGFMPETGRPDRGRVRGNRR